MRPGDYLTQRDFNVTLQDNANAPDDGSLSVYFSKKGIPYVNIEAEASHLNAQIEMVRSAREMLEEMVGDVLLNLRQIELQAGQNQ
jgi:hypothetical protein